MNTALTVFPPPKQSADRCSEFLLLVTAFRSSPPSSSLAGFFFAKNSISSSISVTRHPNPLGSKVALCIAQIAMLHCTFCYGESKSDFVISTC